MFAEKVRDHKGLESRWAVLQDTRIEYFRGKDFASLLQTHADLRPSTSAVPNSTGASNSNNHNHNVTGTESEEDLGNLLLKRKLILRCDRVLKTPRPGKTKLSKWPARLELFPVHSHISLSYNYALFFSVFFSLGFVEQITQNGCCVPLDRLHTKSSLV